MATNENDVPKSNKKDKNPSEKKPKNKGKKENIYFLIFYPRKQKEKSNEFIFSESEITPEKIFTNEIQQEKGIYSYQKIFKFNGKADNKYNFEFEIGKDNYIISFEVKENSFIYDVELKKGNKILKNIAKEIIDQKADYHKKLNIFLEALKKNKEEDKREALYKETIDLFAKKKGFIFLISLFVQIYKNKELCPLLMEKFKEMNSKTKENEKNMDRSKDLEQYVKTFKEISSLADNLIESNDYDPIQFYGILLSYLNYYDHKNFLKIFEKLFNERWECLYEILLIYYSHFLNPIKQDLDFFVKFFNYSASNKDFNNFENGLNYIRDIETCVIVIEKTKEQIYDKYVNSNNSFKPIKFKANLELIKKEKSKEIEEIIGAIESIIKYSKEKNALLVYFTSNFWIKILKDYNISDELNIKNCYELREIFIKYNNLVNDIFENDKKSDIKKDINKYFERDEFAFILDKNIKKLLDSNKKLTNSEILGYVEQFNPYYIEEKYLYKRETYIFDYINLDDKDQTFIETFKKLEFEKMFKDNIIDFLNKMISKIKNISNFGTILEIIDIKKILKVNEFFNQLKDKFEQVVKRQIDSLTNEKLNEAVKIVAKFVDLLYIHENNCKFIEQKINKLNKDICFLIYNELMGRCKGEIYIPMKELIYKKFLNKLDNIDNIIKLIDNLDERDKKMFLKELMNKCLFTKEEYYSDKENTKILLLCELNKKGIIKITDEDNYFGDIEKVLGKIRKDLEGEIGIKKLDEFLKNDEKLVKERLSLIKIILGDYEPETEYTDLKKKIALIKNDISELNSIKNALLIFHRNSFKKEINDISNIVKDLNEKNLNNYKIPTVQESIKNLKRFQTTEKEIIKVKDFLLFKVLYDEALGNNQEKRFDEATKKLKEIEALFEKNATSNEIYQKNKDIFNKIKDMLSNNESKANNFIDQMIKHFKIKDKKDLISELTLIFKSKMYEMDLKSIIYFFESLNIQKDNNKNKWDSKISSKYKALSEMNLKDLKESLKELEVNKIYDYKKSNNYFKLFTSLYEKKEAIDFLLSKINQNKSKTKQDINALYDRIDPTNRTITLENIKDTEECIKIFNEFKE